MAKTYSDLFAEVRGSVKIVPLDELKKRFDAAREAAVHPRGRAGKGRVSRRLHPGRRSRSRASYLEQQFEQKLPDRNAEIILYCAGGTRSAFAAKSSASSATRTSRPRTPASCAGRTCSYPVELPPQLTPAQLDRYSRHILLPEVGERGQEKLLKARVLLLGAGGLGAPSSLYLAAAGVGTIGLVDADVVDASNLQRQIVHATSRLGMPKVDSAEKALVDLNPDVKVVKFEERLLSTNVDRIFGKGWDAIVDGCDNFPTRYLVNDASLFHKIPVVHGSIFRFDGQVTTFMPWRRPLLPLPLSGAAAAASSRRRAPRRACSAFCRASSARFRRPKPSSSSSARATSLNGRLLTYDSMKMSFRTLKLRRDDTCPACGKNPTIKEYIDYEGFCAGTANIH